MAPVGTVFVAPRWGDPATELSYVTRGIAAGASRCGPVHVLVSGPHGSRRADGGFNLECIGEEGDLRWPERLPSDGLVIADELTPAVSKMLEERVPRAVLFLAGPGQPDRHWRRLHLVEGRSDEVSVGMHIPVNLMAEVDRHHGFGFTDYVLILSDRMGTHEDPPDAAAWITSAFYEADVVVVENALASAWKGRALRGTVSVDSRMDLWRLMAHARLCVDLAPGPYVARECIEALRFGTPILVPGHSGVAAHHAGQGRGSTFEDPGELVAAVSHLEAATTRAAAGAAGRRYAEAQYGNPDTFVAGLREILATL